MSDPKQSDSGATPPGAGRRPTHDEQAADAQAELDRLRHEAGGALSGMELQRRQGLSRREVLDDPELDWRLTPRNIALQVLGVAIFIAVVWFLISLMVDSWGTLLAPRGGEG